MRPPIATSRTSNSGGPPSRAVVCAALLLAVSPLPAARARTRDVAGVRATACAPAPQDPVRPPVPPEQDPDRPPGPQPRGVDPAESAADLLRRLLRGEVRPPTRPEDLPEYVEIPPGPKPPRHGDSPVQGPAGPPVPRREPSPEPGFDAALRALERVLPDAERVDLPQADVRDAPDLATGPAAPPAPAPAVPSTDPAAAAIVPDAGRAIRGQLTVDYRGRVARNGFGSDFEGSSGRSDQDLTTILGFEVGDRERDAVTGTFLGRGRFDLDGIEGLNPFNGINETYDGGTELHLWDAWIDVHRVPGLDVVRIGRQTLFDTPQVLFLDGLYTETEEFGELRFRGGGFVGLPSRFHSGHDAGEFLSGVHGEARPWSGGRARVEWVHVDDERDSIEFTDDLVAFSVWQAVGEVGYLRARHTLLDGSARDVDVRLQAAVESLGLSGRLAYTELLDTQRRLTLEFDPFWESAFDQFPYRQLSTHLARQVHEQVELAVGLDVRRLTDVADEGRFNREFERYYATLTWVDDPDDDTLSIGLSADLYDARRGDDVFAVYGDVRYRPRDDWDLAFGTDYSLYRYDWQAQTEREDVYAGFVRIEHDLDAALAVRVEYRLEDAAGDLFHTFDVRATWTF